MRNKDRITIILLLMSIAGLVASVGFIVSRISNQLQQQFEFETSMYMCMENSAEYLAPCHLERDEDGSYNWYINPEEGRK